MNLSSDTAVFMFNVNMFSEGEPVGTWNTTGIHQRAGDGWEMIHTHWSNPAPPTEAWSSCRRRHRGRPVDVPKPPRTIGLRGLHTRRNLTVSAAPSDC